MLVSGVKKIFLSQVAKFRAKFARDFQMVVDDKPDVRAFGDRQDFFRHAPDFFGRRIFGAQLDQIAAAVAELLRDEFGRAAMQIGRVHEGVKFAVRERFHANNLTETNKGNGKINFFDFLRFRSVKLFQSDKIAKAGAEKFGRHVDDGGEFAEFMLMTAASLPSCLASSKSSRSRRIM